MATPKDDWNTVSLALLKDPHDFKLWQSLIHFAETQDGLINQTQNHIAIDNLRNSYEAFLEKHPLLLKYWISYALWERKLNHNDKAELVFLRALELGCHDVSLWISFLNFKIETLTDNVDDLLKLFEAARLNIGYHYHSFEFYQLYLKFLETYADERNCFRKKSIFLLRVMLEIPLYNYSSSFELIFEFVSSAKLLIDELSAFMHDSDLKELKKLRQNNKSLIQQDVKRIISDAYVVNQAKSYELFAYERLVACSTREQSPSFVSLDRLENWISYLSFVEFSYPFEYTIQLYERSLLGVCNHHEIVLRYADFCINKKQYGKARNLIRKAMCTGHRSSSVDFLICLVDIEIVSGHIMAAKDLITSYIRVNSEVLYRIFEKLMHVEALVYPKNDTYLCSLAHEIMFVTKNPLFFEILCRFTIPRETLATFFLGYAKKDIDEEHRELAVLMGLENDVYFWTKIKTIVKENDLKDVRIPSRFA